MWVRNMFLLADMNNTGMAKWSNAAGFGPVNQRFKSFYPCQYKGNNMGTYIKMLRAKGAEWIQKKWMKADGDFYVEYWEITPGEWRRVSELLSMMPKHVPHWERTIWLPSIEDLLGMLKSDNYLIHELLIDINHFMLSPMCPFEFILFDNFKETILAFIQHELKGLKWGGEEWVHV